MLRTASKISTVDQHATPRVKEIRPSHKLDDYLPQRGPQRPRGAGWPLPGVEGPAFGFNIQEVIDLFDSWGWVVNVFFDGLEEDDK